MQIKDLRPKRALRVALLILLLGAVEMVKAQTENITFADDNVKAVCVANWDTDGDGELSYAEAAAVTSIGNTFMDNDTIVSFDELQYFTNLTSIGVNAFVGCSSLTSIVIPISVISIEPNPFSHSSVAQIIVDSGNTVFDSRDNCNAIIETSTNKLVTGCKNTVIPYDVTAIGEYAFAACTELTSITIPNSVTTIGGYAFYCCYGLASIEIPNSVTYIGEVAFGNCGLTSIEIPNSVTSIERSTFMGCSLTSVDIPNSVIVIGEYAFSDCSQLTSIAISSYVTTIGDYAFSDCSSLEQIVVDSGNSVYDSRENCNAIIKTSTNELVFGCKNTIIPNSVVSIGGGSFSHCFSLTLITIPNSVAIIGDGAFAGCRGLVSIVIPNSVTSIGSGAFSYCRGLTSVVIPNSVAFIGDRAFSYCSGLASITIPDSVSSIGNQTFSGCSGLTSIVIPNSVTSIGDWAFSYCTGLSSIVIPNSVTFIGNGAFSGCSGLTSIVIPNSVTSIGDWAFSYCSGLTSMTVLANNPPTLETLFIGSLFVFNEVNKDIPVYVPCGAIEAYQNAEGWNEFTNFQEYIPEIEVVSSDENKGTVAILQEPDCENEAIVQANPIGDYTFFNWTENGEIVSTEATYIFTPTGDQILVANFGEITNHWTPNANAFEENMTFTCVVQMDGVEQRTTTLEVGAFCGEECRGTQFATYFPPTDRYIFQLLVFGETNDVISFRLYDHQLQQELLLTPPECVAFNSNGYGSLLNPYVLNFTSNVLISAETNPADAGTITGTGDYTIGSEVTLTAEANSGYQFFNWTLNGEVVSTNASYQFTVTEAATYVANFKYVHTQALNNGWSWWSSYIELSNNDGLGQLENSIGSAGILIKSRNSGYVEAYQYNDTTNWFGTLSSVNNDQMYKIHTNAACDAIIVGDVALPSDHPIEINNGWNWVGFPCSQSVSVDVAMSGFSPENNDIIKGRNGFTTYYSDGNYTMWFGTLNIFEPGQGYMYRSNSITQKSLVFETSRGEGYNDNITPENNVFRPADGSFADNMTFTAVVELDGIELRSEDYELAAFVGDECRGSVKLMYVEPFNRYIAFLTIFGEQEEDLHFQLTDGVAMSFSTDQLSYVVDGIMGTLDNPIVLHFGTMDVDENALVNVRVYPNPSEGIFNIEGKNIRKVEVFNMFGQPIYSEGTGNGFLKLDLTSRAAGIYLIRIVTDNGIWNNQIIKR